MPKILSWHVLSHKQRVRRAALLPSFHYYVCWKSLYFKDFICMCKSTKMPPENKKSNEIFFPFTQTCRAISWIQIHLRANKRYLGGSECNYFLTPFPLAPNVKDPKTQMFKLTEKYFHSFCNISIKTFTHSPTM